MELGLTLCIQETALYISVASVVIHHGDSNDADGVIKSTTINLYGPQILFLITA